MSFEQMGVSRNSAFLTLLAKGLRHRHGNGYKAQKKQEEDNRSKHHPFSMTLTERGWK